MFFVLRVATRITFFPFQSCIQLTLPSSISAIPIPIIYGFFIDQSCVVFKPRDPCSPDGQTDCLHYNTDSLRLRFHLVTFVLSCVQPVFLFISWFNARKTVYPSKKTREKDKQLMARIVRRSSDIPTHKESYSVTSMWIYFAQLLGLHGCRRNTFHKILCHIDAVVGVMCCNYLLPDSLVYGQAYSSFSRTDIIRDKINVICLRQMRFPLCQT
jgi:hypothetical protein